MKQFNLFGTTIRFTDRQEEELILFSEIFPKVYSSVHSDFENQFFNFQLKTNHNGYNDDEEMHMDYVDGLKNIFVSSCIGVKDSIYSILQQLGIYSYDKSELDKDIEINIESAFELNYECYFLKGENLVNRTKTYNNNLKNNERKRLFFITDLVITVSTRLIGIILEEIYAEKHPSVAKRDIRIEELDAFDEEDYEVYLIHNKLRNLRENIEAQGINETNSSLYMKTLERDPFSIRTYFYIVEKLGDTNQEVKKLYTFVFGKCEILEGFKAKLLRKLLEQKYGNTIKNIDKEMDENKLNRILEQIQEIRLFYGMEFTDILEIEVENRLLVLERLKKTVEGKEYKTLEEAQAVRKELDNINRIFLSQSLKDMQYSCDELVKLKFDTNQANEKVASLLRTLNNYKESCRNSKENLKKAKIEYYIAGVLGIIVGIGLLSLGILGIAMDVVIAIFINVLRKKWKKYEVQSKQYEEYCKIYVDNDAETHLSQEEAIYNAECGTNQLEQSIKEKAEIERRAKERAETERLVQENKKRDIDSRTVLGTVYKSLSEAENAKKEHAMIDILKSRLMETKSQKKRKEIFGQFNEQIVTIDAKNRYELLKDKVTREVPLNEKINGLYGITVLITFVFTMILTMTVEGEFPLLGKISILWSGFGVWIWPIWKIVLFIRSKGKIIIKILKTSDSIKDLMCWSEN